MGPRATFVLAPRQPRWRRPSATSTWIKLHVTTRGQWLILLCAILALLGLDTRRSQIFALFALASAPLLASAHVFLRRRPVATVTRGIPQRLTAGRAVAVTATFTPDPRRLNVPLVLTWPLWPREAQGVRVDPDQVFLDTRARQPVQVGLRVSASQRGRFVVPGLAWARTDPLGLLCGMPARQPDQVVLVCPPLFSLQAPELPAGRRYQPGGIPLASRLGDSLEFVGTRDYREGDPLRRIHWRSWARRGRPVVREYQEEYFSRVALVLDTFLAPRARRRQRRGFEAAVSTLGSLAATLGRTEDVLDILIAGPQIYELQMGRSLGALQNVLDVLACVEPCHDQPFRSLEPRLFEILERLTTVVLVLLEWDAPREAFITRLLAMGVRLHVVVVRDQPLPPDVAARHAGNVLHLSLDDVEQRIRDEAAQEQRT